MYDIIGKRRWLYLFSLIITIPGLVLILLTPFTDLGLQFSIDYTGGTRWVIRFEDRSVTPEQVRAVFEEDGLAATVIREADDYLEIRTEQVVGLREAPAPSRLGRPQRRAFRERFPGAQRQPERESFGEPECEPFCESVGVPVCLGQPECLGVAGGIGLARRIGLAESSRTGRQHRDPDRRAARCDRHDPPGPVRADREPDRPHVDRRRREQ